MIREMVFYDGVNDLQALRYDAMYVKNGSEPKQACVSFVFPKSKIDLAQVRQKAMMALGRHIGYADLIPLPFPQGCRRVEPEARLMLIMPISFCGPTMRKKTHSLAGLEVV